MKITNATLLSLEEAEKLDQKTLKASDNWRSRLSSYDMDSLKITGATLLSAEEAEELDKEILKTSDNWWLRSPGFNVESAAVVGGEDGYVYDNGLVFGEFGIRPALEFSDLSSSGLEVGDRFEFGDYSFTVISDQYALCDDIVGECIFREDWKTDDANIYEKSDVKRFVDDWYEKTLEQMKSEEKDEYEEDKEM